MKGSNSKVLCVAGFDPSGGAGVLRDFWTLEKLGLSGAFVVTVNTCQSDFEFKSSEPTSPELLACQVEVLRKRHGFASAKVGLVYDSLKSNEKLAGVLKELSCPIVFDPVIGPSSGGRFIRDVSAIKPILEISRVITPNFKEYELIKGLIPPKKWVVVKGSIRGDLVVDELFYDGELVAVAQNLKSDSDKRGTGCVFSTSLAAMLALGEDEISAFFEAVKLTRAYRKGIL